MDVLDWLNNVLSEARWLRTPEEALALLPDIGVDAPAQVSLLEGRDQYRGFPVAFADRIREPLASFLVKRISEQVEDRGGEQLNDLCPERLGRDSLVLALAELLVEAGELGQRSTSLVMLELARQCGALCTGDLSGIERRMPAVQAQLARCLPRLSRMEPDRRGAALACVAWSLSARLSFAWAMAGKLNPVVRPTRLHQALVANKVALVIAHGRLELPRDASLLAAVAGIKTGREQLEAVHTGVAAACRHAFSTDTASAKALRDLAGTRSDPASLALDPAIASWVLNDLEEIAPGRVLTGAGVSRSQLRILTDRRAIPALAAGYARMCRVARAWDLLSCAANRCVPIEVGEKKVRCAMGDLHGRPYRLLAPRGERFQAETYVVGVNRDLLFEAAANKAADRGVAVYAALSAIWRSLEEAALHGDGAISPADGPWYAAFPTGKAAEEFERQVERRFRSPLQLDLAPLGPVVSLDSTVGIRIEGGVCVGGWDGETLRLRGAAVDKALGAETGGRADLGALGDALSRQAAAAASPPPPPEEPRPAISTLDPPTQDPFTSLVPPVEESRPSDIGFSSGSAPVSRPLAEETSIDMFSTSIDSLDSDLSFGGDDPFSSSAPGEPQPSYSGADDPFATMQPDLGQFSSKTSLPPSPEADEDAFAGIEREEVRGALGGPSDDPLISNPPIGEDSLGLAEEATRDGPFSETVDSIDESSRDMDMEIVDDDDSEVVADPDSAGIFFLPPPTKEQLENLGARLDTPPKLADLRGLEPLPEPPADEGARTLVPERSLDSLDASLDRPATLVPEVSVDAAAGTLVPDDLAPYDFEDEEREEARVSLNPTIAEADNLLNIESADSEFGFTRKGAGDLDEALEQLVDSQEVVLDQPSEDRDLGLTETGFMVSGPAAVDPHQGEDPFGFAEADDSAADADPFAVADARDSLPVDIGGVGVSSDDVRHLFEGYVWLEHEGTLVFGRRYGDDRLVDVHRYELGGALADAYRSFVHDKAEERFIPQTASLLVLTDGTPLNDVDIGHLKEALAAGGS
ncbi:MAG TPA: hypothetical protein QGF58_06780 [Myxococcota bacterium]|nr:hypothetical protein [Myxococcota bacterium]